MVQPAPDEMVEEDVAAEVVVDDKRIGRILRPQVDKRRVARHEERVRHHFPSVVTGQVVAQLRLSPVDVVQRRLEVGRLTRAEFAIRVRQELRRVPRRRDEWRRFDVAVLGVQLAHHRRVDEQQVANKVDVAARYGRVTVKHFDVVHHQLAIFA